MTRALVKRWRERAGALLRSASESLRGAQLAEVYGEVAEVERLSAACVSQARAAKVWRDAAAELEASLSEVEA